METKDFARFIVSTVVRHQPSMTTDAAHALADAIIGDMQAANFKIIPPEIPRSIEPHDHSGEKRRVHRTRVLKSATVVFNDGNCSMSCQVLDLSPAGARLRPADLQSCPKEFRLKFPNGSVHDCEVKWREGYILGVRFL